MENNNLMNVGNSLSNVGRTLSNMPTPSQGAIDEVIVIGAKAVGCTLIVIGSAFAIDHATKHCNIDFKFKDIHLKTTSK